MADTGPGEDVVYRDTVEVLFRTALGKRITPKCRDRIRREGIDLDGGLDPVYPRERFYRCVRILGEELFPELDPDQRMVQLGTLFMDGYQHTVIGRAALAAARFMGPRRTLARMSINFETSNNYMKTECVEDSPGRVRVTLSETSGVPGYFEGAIRTGLTLTGAKDVAIRREAYDGRRCTLVITWSQ